MALRVTATDALEIAPRIWSFSMPPHQVRHFGNPAYSIGQQSVLLLASCEYDPVSQHLHFDIDSATPINVGTLANVIGIATDIAEPDATAMPALVRTHAMMGDIAVSPGDREFLRLTRSELSSRMAAVSENLLLAVRQKSPGSLKRGQARNFSETPDNFWYVIVQPRVDELSITVRGSVSHFESCAELEIKDDRGNTRFKVRSEKDIQAALKLIFHAIRKR